MSRSRKRLVWPLVPALLMLFLLNSCGLMLYQEEMLAGERFIDLLLEDNADEAYAFFPPSRVSREEFDVLWSELRAYAAGATEAEVIDYRLDGDLSSVTNPRHHLFAVRFDNGRALLLDLFIEGLDLAAFSSCTTRDITDFTSKTDKLLAVARIAGPTVTLVFMAFVIWMTVDCARRRLRFKPLWILLILFGTLELVLTLFADPSALRLGFGLFVLPSRLTRDILDQSMTLRLMLPIGAAVYFFLRKRLTTPPAAVEEPPSAL